MTENSQSSIKPIPIIVIIIVLAALAAGGWWLRSRSAKMPVQHPTPTIDTSPEPAPQSQKVKLTLFVPNDNAMLGKQTVTETVKGKPQFAQLTKAAIATLLKKAPENFPKGAKLLGVQTAANGVAKLNFNKDFANTKFWRGEATTVLAVYSIVNSVTSIPANDFKALKVKLLVAGKSPQVLGGLDVSEPLAADTQWVAPQ